MAKGGPDCVLQTNRIIVPLEWEVHGRPVTLGGPKILSSVASGRGKAACEAKRAAPVVEHGGMLWHALACAGLHRVVRAGTGDNVRCGCPCITVKCRVVLENLRCSGEEREKCLGGAYCKYSAYLA